jgi:hypothetical protein
LVANPPACLCCSECGDHESNVCICIGEDDVNNVVAREPGFIDVMTDHVTWIVDEQWFGNFIMDQTYEDCECV